MESPSRAGCADDADCAVPRTCIIGVCWWPQDAEFVEPQLESLGQHILEALQQASFAPLSDNFLSNGDIMELFDYDRSAMVDAIFAYDRTLSADFNGLLDEVPVQGCAVNRVVAGSYAPIPQGDEHTVSGLLRIKNTRIELSCGDEQRSIVLANIVWHLQQWKILTLTSPAMLFN